MKIKLYTTHFIVLQADSIDDGVKLGILHEQLKATGRDYPIMGDGVMEIPLAKPDKERFPELLLTTKRKNKKC